MRWVIALSLATGCGGVGKDEHTNTHDDTDEPTGETPVTLPCTAELGPSEFDQSNVQTALIEAESGDVVCLEAGTYRFDTEVSIAVDGLTLRGAGKDETILDFSAMTVGANGLAILSDGVVIEDLQVFDTPGDGVRATDVDGITFRRVGVIWPDLHSLENGAYGLYPVGSSNVLIEGCEVTGARDAGVYVGQSKNILVRDNEVYGNVAGIEIENSTDSEVTGNHVYDNTGGVFVFNLPNLPVQDGKRAKVHDNLIENNNIDNFAEPGTVVAGVPPGVGVFVIAADTNEVHDNTIRGNKTAAVLVIGFTEFTFPGETVDDETAYNRYSDDNYIHHNTFQNNGTDPVGDLAGYIKDRPVPSVVSDGCPFQRDPTICLFENSDETYIDIDICGLFQNPVNGAAAVTCEGTTLDSITL